VLVDTAEEVLQHALSDVPAGARGGS
jgi:hypothetical protein